MSVIVGRAELLADELEGAPREHAETIERWADDVTDLVERVRAVVGALTAPDDQPVEPVDISAMVHGELDRIAQTYSVPLKREIPAGVLACWFRPTRCWPRLWATSSRTPSNTTTPLACNWRFGSSPANQSGYGSSTTRVERAAVCPVDGRAPRGVLPHAHRGVRRLFHQ